MYVLSQIQEFFCSREFIVSSDPRSVPQTAKKQFFYFKEVTLQGRAAFSPGRDSQLDTDTFAQVMLKMFAFGMFTQSGASPRSNEFPQARRRSRRRRRSARAAAWLMRGARPA